MATDLPEIRQRITVDDGALGGLGKRFGGIAGTLGKAVAGGAAIAAGAVGAFVVQGVRGAIDVDRGLREVVTLFGETGDAADETYARLADGVGELSNSVGIAQDVLVDGLYSAISAGIPEDNAFTFMETAAKASVAGVTDVETAVDGLSTVINAWSLEATDAEAVSDSMFAAVQGGKTTFEELSSSMFQVAPAAAAAGIGYDQVNAAIATLTAAGTPTSVATTQIRQALVELDKPTSQAAKAFEEISGQTFRDFIAGGGDVQGALKILQDEAEGTGAAIGDYFGSVEAGAAATTLGATNAEKFAEELERQEGAAGAAGDAFETMEQSTARQMEKLKTNLANVGIEIGSRLLPILNRIISWATTHLPPAIEAGAAALGRLGEIFGTIWEAIQPVIERARSFVDLIVDIFANPDVTSDGWIGALEQIAVWVRTVVDTITGWVERWRSGSDEMTAKTEGLRAFLASTWEQISGIIAVALEVIVEILRFAGEIITGIWERVGEQILTFVRRTWTNIQRVISGVLDVIKGIFEIFAGLLTGDWSRLWEGIKTLVAGVWRVIRGIVSQAWNGIKTLFNVGRAQLASIWSALWDRIKGLLSSAWSSLTSAVSTGISTVVDYFRRLPGRIVDAIASLAGQMRRKGTEALSRFREAVSTGVSRLIDYVRGIPGKILDGLGNVGSMLFDAGKAILRGLGRGIRSAASAPIDAVKNVAGRIRDLLPGSPVKTGPLRTLNRGHAGRQIARMVADGINRDAGLVAAAAGAMADRAAVRIRGPVVDGATMTGGVSLGDARTADRAAQIADAQARADRAAAAGGVVQHFDVQAFDVREAASELGAAMAYGAKLITAPRG